MKASSLSSPAYIIQEVEKAVKEEYLSNAFSIGNEKKDMYAPEGYKRLDMKVYHVSGVTAEVLIMYKKVTVDYEALKAE